MYKALLTDIDGTVGFIGTDGTDIVESTVKAVRQAQTDGKIIACATGRGWPKTKPVVNKLGITSPCVIEGGSCIIDPVTEKVLWEQSLNKDRTKKILGIFKEITDYRITVETILKPITPIVQLSNPDGSNRIVYLMRLDADTALKVLEAVNKTGFAIAHKTTPSWYGRQYTDVHVTNPDGTKEHAIAEWQRMMGVTKEETIGLGDSENDIPIFRSVGLKLVVGNAHENLRKIADQVLSRYNEGGLERAIDILVSGNIKS